jgi:hypothetical protein
MTFRQPPAIAFWCLVNLSDPDEGLLGDLFEEYQHRHSRWWFWRQVAIAIVVGFARNVWTHKLENVAGGLHGAGGTGPRRAIHHRTGDAGGGVDLRPWLVQCRQPPGPTPLCGCHRFSGSYPPRRSG